MNVQTIEPINRDDATRLFRAYSEAHRIRPNDNDRALALTFRAMSKGLRVFDLVEAFRATGVDELGRPRLAIVRADATRVFYRHVGRGGGMFARFDLYGKSRRRNIIDGGMISIPDGTFDESQIPKFSGNQIGAVTPTIPPAHRPRRGLTRHHILFEAEWRDVPHDPFLVRHLFGSLFVVVAEWDLSEIEQTVLRMVERYGGTR